MNPPCHNCKFRTATCHATCTAHALWKMEGERQKKELKRKKTYESQADGVLYKRKRVGKRIESKKG